MNKIEEKKQKEGRKLFAELLKNTEEIVVSTKYHEAEELLQDNEGWKDSIVTFFLAYGELQFRFRVIEVVMPVSVPRTILGIVFL